jgi:hypothetical protein
MLCISPLACLSNSSYTFHYLLVTSSMYLSLSSLCNRSLSVTLCAYFSFLIICSLLITLLHPCCKTHFKHKTMMLRNLKCQEETRWPLMLPAFVLGQPILFISNSHFFQTLHSIHDDFSLVPPCGKINILVTY